MYIPSQTEATQYSYLLFISLTSIDDLCRQIVLLLFSKLYVSIILAVLSCIDTSLQPSISKTLSSWITPPLSLTVVNLCRHGHGE